MFLMPDWDHDAPMPPLTITRVVRVDRPCDLSVAFRSSPEKFLVVRTLDQGLSEALVGPRHKVHIDPDVDGVRTLTFAGHEPTFGFELKFAFCEGAVRCRVKVLGSVGGRFRVTQENWTGDLARKGTLRINLASGGPLLAFVFGRVE